MENPSLSQGPLPSFSNIDPEHIEPTLKQIISQNRAELSKLLSQTNYYTWENLMQPLEEMQDRLSQMWAPINHLHATAETEALRIVYNACLPLLTEYHTELLQHERLYNAVKFIAESTAYSQFNPAQRKVIADELRDFKLAGVSLPLADKMHYAQLQKQLSKFTTQFSENLLDATHAWSMHVTEHQKLDGLPEQIIKILENNAQQQNIPGWVLTLDYPCYSTIMKYSNNRELRWLMYEAYVTRASDQGPKAGLFDNSQLMEDILKTRHELATVLGFKNFAEYSLATKMADTSERVLHFLHDLADRSKKFAKQEIQELTAFAKETDGLTQLEAWDVPFYSERLREKTYAFTQEDLRPYFPIDKVLTGMFIIINKLFGLKICERQDFDTWHSQVRFFDVFDANNTLRGSFYTDLYVRPNKRDGAWMDECRTRRQLADGSIQHPIAFLTCNFTRPLDNKPALLTHDDVQTLFHEFGHCLHHILTKVGYVAVSGINGVPWDAVEFPSQFMEFWCWEKETIPLISSHYETGGPVPDLLHQKMIAAKNFQAGMQMLRQLEFSLFDFRLHLEYDAKKQHQVLAMIDDVRSNLSVVTTPKFNRFPHSFSHIFAGGYAAGYYSYKWAEVLSSDAFSRFEEEGIFNSATGKDFLENILEQGGVYDPMKLFIAFRGREPEIDALLRHNGLVPTLPTRAGEGS